MKKVILYIIMMVITSSIFGQSIFTVTKTTDPNPFQYPFNNDDNLCDPEMYGTLQWAINKANDDNAESIIEFNIPGSGPHEIALNYYLPQIKSSTTIDATTQVGYTEGNPAITLSGQNKFASGFDVNNATTLINGIHIKNFNNNGVLLYNASNSRVENCVFTSITNTIDTKTAAVGIRIVGSNNVELYGNDIQVKLNSTSSLSPTYGVFVDKSFYCIIGGTEEGKSNLIANCGYVGVAVRGCNYNKISGNIFDNNEKAIEMVYSANAGIQPPEITDYQNGILSGTALPNSTIEVFGSTGEENANEYLESTIADGGGGWSVEVSTGYEYFVGTQRDGENNSSGLSSVFINTITTQLLTMYQNTDSIDLDDFLYASILPDAIQYEFNVIQTDSGVNQIITKDVNYFSLLELENNEAYYDKEYKIKVRAVFENEVSAWGDEIVLRTIDKQKYRYGIAHIRILPSYNNAIIPFSGIDNSVPILIEGYDELNSILKVNTIEKTFPKILNKLPDLFNIYTIYFDESFSTDSLISWANQTAYFEYVSKYPIYKINEDVNDPYFENPPTQCTFCDNNLGQWSLQQLNAENTWNLVENDNIIKIAIVDNAVRYDHQDLHDNIYINTGEIPVNVLSILLSDTYDTNENNFVDANEFVNYCNEISPLSISNLYDVMNNQSEFSDIFDGIDNDDNGYVDDIIGWDASDEYNNDNDPYPGVITTQGEKIFAHGTHVAGIASAVTNNNEGMASLSFNHSRIIPVKTTKDTNSSNFLDNSYDGVQYAIAAGADIINMSWGAEWTDAIANYPLYSVITSAHYNLGITFIASMGNDWGYKKNAPACIPVVVAIGATNSSQSVANFSTHGNYMDFFAPGADILSTYSAGINEYFCESGTSMSCPLASSLWALIKSINPNATFNQIYNCITSTCYKPSFWSTDCTETVDPTPWSTQISKYGIINPYDAVLCFNELPPVAMFEHLGGSTCPETDLYFYSISSGGPISSEMTLSWTCSNPEVLFSTPSALNTNISFPDEGTYTIVFTIFDVNHEIISQYEENIFAAYPKVEFNNVYNFSSCYGFEVSVFLEFSGNPPFSFNYRLNDGPEITINNVVSQNYSLIVDGSNILSVGSSNIVSITNVSDYSCLNSDDVFITTFEIIDCDLCSRNHNNVMTWNQGQMQFAPSSFSYTPSTNTFPESSCAISDNFGNPLLLMKGDYLYNLTCINALNEYTEITGSEFGFSSKEGSIILPHDSGNPYLYYALVVTDNNSSSTFPMSLKYYLIDVSEMQIINTEIILKDDVEVMEACKISDDYGYWILTNTKSINKNNLYKLQNNILEFQGEIEVPYRNISAHMCFSPNMNLLAAKQEIRGTTEFTYATNIYNFNRDINCPIEDRLSLVKSIEHVTFTPYNYEFSPNSQLLYITGNESGLKLMQFPIYNSDNNPTYIKEGEQGTLSGMRLGLDGKLYIELIVSGGVDKISYLRAPNEIGEACMYVNGAYISNTLLGIELSRRIPEIPFNFSIKEEVIDCQNNLIIEDLTGYEPFTYLWSNSSTDDHINNIVPGEYSVTISDMYNCTLSKNINVQEFNTVTCFINAVNDICFGTINSGSVDFTITDGAAPYIVELIADVSVSETLNVDNYGSYTFENLGVNDYSIQVIDDNGCIFETNFSIGLASEMILTISVLNIPCEGSANGSAYADVQFGVSPYSYIWSNGETNQTAVLLTGGEFEVTVIDNNNCSVTGDIFISENESPSITLTAVPGVICAGESSTITAGTTGGLSPYIYEWSPILPQQENNIVSPSTTTTYYVTATDQNECSAWDNITVEVEDIQISSSVAYEYGNSTGTVDFVFVPSNISTTDFSQITIVNNQTSELFDFTGLNDPYTLDAGYNYTASFVSINGCIYTNEFSIIFAENFICSTIVNPITCEYNYNGSIELDIQGGVSPYIAYVFLDGNIFNYTFNTPGIHTIDLSGTPPTNSTISISITDSNGAVSTHLVNGIDFAWENGITLTNDNLGSQVNFSNIAIQLGNASNQSLIIHQDVTFTNCTIYTATHPYSNVSETQWTVYNPYTLKLENTIVKSGCPDQMWQGIRGIIVGEVIFDDNPTPIAPSQLLIYTSEIHDAIKAVEAANGSLGAVVIKAKNSKFYNNVYDLYFDWSNFPQSNCLIRGNEFITNDILNNPNLYPKAHVYMNYVSGITFSNNHFENTILYMPLMPSDVMYTTNKRGIGIEANFSSFTVTQPNHTYPSLTPLWTNSFEGLYYGIIAKGQNTYAPRIYHNNFTNNFRGVYMRDVNGARLLFNDFETAKYNLSFDYIGIPINAGLPATNVSYAAYIANCNNFKIEENSIKNGEAGLYVYNTGEAAGLEVYKNSFGDGDTPGNYNMKAGTIVVGKNSNFISNDIYNQGLNGLQTRCNTYTSTENAISVINGNMRKNQGAQYGQTNELAGNQFNDTYSPAMDFKVQIHTGNSLLWDFSRFDLGRYNYWQHENDESLDFYTQLDNFSELKIQTYTLSVFNPLNSCLTNYPGPVIIDAELELSTASALRSSATGKENQYNDLIDRGDTEYLINLTESMSNRNFNSIFPILCNDGYLSDIVFETILDNRSTNRPRIATVLISNSPLPDNIMEMVENSAYLKNGHKKQIRKVQVGTSPRLIFEYEIADIKQDISKIESNLINHAIDNDSVPAIRETVINYLINNAEINSINYVNRFNLQLAQTDIIEAKNTLDDLRFYATSLQNENIATEIERYCDVHDIYISLLQDTVYDKALLVQNQEFLREAALDFSPLYSGKAQTLYEMATDSTFIEYTPLPFEEILPRSVIIEQEDDIFMADLNIYPNPTRDKLYIEYNFQSYSEEGNEELLQILGYKEKENCISGEIKIYTIDGKLIISKTLEQPSGIETIDMQNYPPASYIIKITDCYGFTKELKFVKQ